MFKKIGQSIFFVVIVALAAIIQLSLIFTWPAFWGEINLVIILLIFFLFFSGPRAAFGAALVAGFCLDLFTFNFFGLYLITLFLTALLGYWILRSWLTNRSLYSFLLLMLAAILNYNLLTGILFSFSTAESARFFLWAESFWLDLAYQSLWGVATGLLAFNLIGAATRRLKPFFLEANFLEKKPRL